MKDLKEIIYGLTAASLIALSQTSCSQKSDIEKKVEKKTEVVPSNLENQIKTSTEEELKTYEINLKDPIYLNDVVADRLKNYQIEHPGLKLRCTLNNENEIYEVKVIPLQKNAVYGKLEDDILDLMYQNREKKGVKIEDIRKEREQYMKKKE
ncbi:hypothetical protein KY334_05715 [Candidatus Woesearchaeota archaeon]|nr:hypothetical protein [Candidatus Woesearchaeota archaeon]